MIDGVLRAARETLGVEAGLAQGLPNTFYCDLNIFRLEQERIFRAGWIAIGHAADLPQPGDVVPVEAAGLPIVLVRDRDGSLRGFHNVCGHRGLRLVDKPCRGKPTILCPYHGWAYDARGALRATPGFGGVGQRHAPGFDPARHALRPVRLAEAFGGLLFADLSSTAPAFADWAAPLLDRWKPYDFACLRHAGTERCTVEANWKLVGENFVDTLHLDWVHPQVVGYSRPEDHFDICVPPAFGSGTRNALSADPLSHAVPCFPALPQELTTRGEFLFLYPNVLLFLMPNQLFTIVLDATAPDRTAERLDFVFVEGGEPEQMAASRAWWVDGWRHLNGQDFEMLRRLQQGRASPAFAGGCFSPVMDQVALAVQRKVLRDLAAGMEELA